ncbi:hypothetical protein JK636_19615 [Clostridium sp. YIM B02515]|uniref:Uncharacterized protein n=1 Tax=Clostridium rhizosphaerae TaxID=2803861 RepID=A0ABS1TEW2_9CLOT|nr:hypothetical protein [Clostridium rhizosphaerae]MBL4937921.1 hypothetical protein [Clostridium rhizosphaerae]
MQNLNFLPDSIKNKKNLKHLKLYKYIFIFLWLICLIQFIVFVYLRNQNNSTDNLTVVNSLNRTQKESEVSLKKNETFLAFDSFLKNINNRIDYDNCIINNNQISMEFTAENINSYYNIIKDIENSDKYVIIKLTPPNNSFDKLKFQLILEVK